MTASLRTVKNELTDVNKFRIIKNEWFKVLSFKAVLRNLQKSELIHFDYFFNTDRHMHTP